MTESCFKWPFSDKAVADLSVGREYESPHFVIGSRDEFEWVIKYTVTFVKGCYYLTLELELFKNSNMESIDVTCELSLIESGAPQGVLFSREGRHFFEAGAKKSLRCERVFPWKFLVELRERRGFTLHCDLKFNSYDGELNTIHQKNDLIGFEQIFNNPKFSDFTLRTKKCEFKVHKVVLMAKSPIFAAMFESDMKENQENFAEITDIEDDVLKELLQYIYCGKVQNMSLYAYELFKAANKYQLGNLQDLCLQTLLRSMTSDNVLDLYSLGDHYSNETLKERSLMYIKNNLKMIVDKSIFQNSSNKILVDVLRFVSSYLK